MCKGKDKSLVYCVTDGRFDGMTGEREGNKDRNVQEKGGWRSPIAKWHRGVSEERD